MQTKKLLPAILLLFVIALFASSCAQHSIRCAIYNQSSYPAQLVITHRAARWPLFSILVKPEKRYIYEIEGMILQQGDSFRVTRNDYTQNYTTVIKEVAILKANSSDTLRKIGFSFGRNIVRLNDWNMTHSW